jgi:hypothetical protein
VGAIEGGREMRARRAAVHGAKQPCGCTMAEVQPQHALHAPVSSTAGSMDCQARAAPLPAGRRTSRGAWRGAGI